MQEELDGFAAFYNEKHQGHKIEWNHTLGTVSLRARFAAGQKELSVSLYQAVVLLLFNDMKEIPFSDVKLHTGIGASPLRNQIYVYVLFLTSVMLFYAAPFLQRMRCCGASFKVWRAERKKCSRNARPEKM
jgi:hypothetical protein